MEEEEENQSTTRPPSSSTMDKETTVLSNLAANHLFLTQFEAFRATIFTLRRNNPDLALSLLQTIVVNGGNLGPNLLFSPNCPSPALLTWLSSIELFQFDNPTSIWSSSVSPELIRVRVEFLLYVQMAITRVWDWIKRSLGEIGVVFEDIETGFEENIVGFENEAELREFKDGIRVLDGVMEVGLRRLKDDLIVSMEGIDNGDEIVVKDADLAVLRKVILMNADIFDAICDNVDRQVGTESGGVDGGGESGSGSGLAITVTTQGRSGRVSSEDDHKVLKSLQKYVQEVHLEEIEECVKNEDVDGAISHIRYLHLGYGVAEDEYRMVFLDFLKKVLSGKDELVDAWQPTRDKLLYIYQETLSSACSHLVQILQAVQDQLLVEEMKMFSSSDNQILPPLKHFQYQMQKKRLGDSNDDNSFSLNTMISACMRDMYHYTRVAGLHFFECIMDTALSAVKNELLEEASSVVSLFPRLQPLVGVMGWDLLANKTAARRKLMQLLWTSKSKLYRLEESYLYENESDEVSCVEYLCDTLCYRLDLASFVACVNSGQPWDIMCSLSLSGHGYEDFQARTTHLDPFVENFILERLSLQSPLRVLFDVVPTIKFEDAIRLISMQPTNSPTGEWKRMQDAELIHMRYALDCAVMALATMEKSRNDPQRYYPQLALNFLKKLKSHLEAVTDLSRKIFLVNIIISLLHVDSITVDFEHCGLEGSIYELSQTSLQQNDDFEEDGNKMVVSFVESLLDMLSCNLPSKQAWEATDVNQEKQALEWRISNARSFIDDWQWRLSVLQKLLPLPELKWGWKEALAVLRAAPSKLLNLCMQKAKYDIGEEAVHRFSLSYEDRATLALSEWVDATFTRVSVEDAVSRAADGTSAVQEIDFSSLQSQIGPMAAILLCVDVASASSKSTVVSKRLLDQAQTMLAEIYPGGSPKSGLTYWEQIREMALVSVARHVLKRLREFLEQENRATIQAILSGESMTTYEHQGRRDRALSMLHQMMEDAHLGKRQFLSGKLHNLARAVADEETMADFGKIESKEQKINLDNDTICFIGLGLRTARRASVSLATGESNAQQLAYDMKDPEKRLFSPLAAKPFTYLSQFILHIAAIGDIVDGTDTTHDFNYFSLIYEWPKDLVTRLVFDRGSTEAAEKVADIMSADFVHEVISACVPPVYPSRFGHGWACIPLVASNVKTSQGITVSSSSAKEAWPGSDSYASASPGFAQYPLELDIIKHLVKLSPVRAVLACVFGSRILYTGSESSIFGFLNKDLLHSPDTDRLFYEFALDQSERFPTLNRWIQMQTNLHRVSEFVVPSKDTNDVAEDRNDAKGSVKRSREHDSDAESDIDDSVGTTAVVSDSIVSNTVDHDVTQDSMHYPVPEDNATTFITFDWENEAPYERAVERLIEDGKLMDALALSDRFLRDGASDHLLRLLIEQEENHKNSGSSFRMQSDSSKYCLRLKDKQLAAWLALRRSLVDSRGITNKVRDAT